jgi:hypothetical protein
VDVFLAFGDDFLFLIALEVGQFLDCFADDLQCSLNLGLCDD